MGEEGPPYTKMGEESLPYMEEKRPSYGRGCGRTKLLMVLRNLRTVLPPWPHGRAVLLFTSLLSILLSLSILLPSTVLLVNSSAWRELYRTMEGWLERHPWDRKVTNPSICENTFILLSFQLIIKYF